MAYRAVAKYLENLTYTKGINPGLTRIATLLKRLDNPQLAYKTIHIAGTNGKGSVARMLATALTNCGLKTGEFTSPHLVSYCERFQINNKIISQAKFSALFEKVKKIAQDIAHLTEFEILTALAFKYFKQEKVDIAVIETGLGGRWDSTNVIKPLCSIITSISLDHLDFLGNSIESITKEKAGIIKKAVPVITGNIPPKALNIIQAVSKQKKAPLLRYKKNSLKTKIQGSQQSINAGVVLSTLPILAKHFDLEKKRFIAGIKNAALPGRFQEIKEKPLIILDGGHNEEASALLVKNLKSFYPKKKKTFIVGILKRKEPKAILKNIEKIADTLILTSPTKDYHSASVLQQQVSTVCKYHQKLRPALKNAKKITNKKDLICITGSFYLVGAFLKQNRNSSL